MDTRSTIGSPSFHPNFEGGQMSVQRRILITPKDIVAVDYECSHCGARYTIPLKKLDRDLKVCANCQERWLNENDPEVSMVRIFSQYLEQLQRSPIKATIRFELSEPDIPGSETLGKPRP